MNNIINCILSQLTNEISNRLRRRRPLVNITLTFTGSLKFVKYYDNFVISLF